MKVLNLYAGLGGNRKLWTGCHVTAVENNPKVAFKYKEHFPQDTMFIADAHEFLRKEYKHYDLIWSSPPCQTHSRARTNGEPVYPDMRLYEEIIFLQRNCKTKWVVENVIPAYRPLIKPQLCSRHYFWANFHIPRKEFPPMEFAQENEVRKLKERLGFNCSDRQLLRNCVLPELGLYVFNCATVKQTNLNQVSV